MSYDTLIFDFGNVLIDIDIPRTESQLKALSGNHWADVSKKWSDSQLFERYELGQLTEPQFIKELQAAYPADACPTDGALTDAWNAMLLLFPPHRLRMLTHLRKKYKIYLLSNTNFTHLTWAHRHISYKYDISDFDAAYFDKTYYSHLIGYRKPHNDIFDFVKEDAQLSLSTTLFFDDMPANIEGAKSAGWHAVLHNNEQDISETLRAHGIDLPDVL
jgi:putative hydrolase of the HAD superfamily